MKLHIKILSFFCICILLLIFIFLVNGKRKKNETKVLAVAVTERLTVVIDAGHGGADGGAVSHNGNIESEVNIGIATRLD
jgi:N-acetylmuramoyl-L-alanine amidase